MKLECNSCSHGFDVDEANLDTDSVKCPKCESMCPIVRTSDGVPAKYARRFFLGRKVKASSRWPNRWS